MQGKAGTLAGVHRGVPLHVRECKVRFTVAAVGSAKQREKRGVLRNRQELTVAKRPSFGRKIERENADFSNKWIHKSGLGWINAKQRNDKVNAEVGLEIVVRLTAANRSDRVRTELHLRRIRSVRRDSG